MLVHGGSDEAGKVIGVGVGSEDAVRVRRVYDPPEKDDGTRVLVDRLWPRGVSKEQAEIDLWAKEVTPSAELRSWYHEDRSGNDLVQDREWISERRHAASDPRRRREATRSVVD